MNPAARGGRSSESAALAACAAAGLRPRLRRTTAAGHAADIARTESGAGDVFVLGGDGTVMEVVAALVGRSNAVAILPGGTGNQLARHLGIPLDVAGAVRALSKAEPVAFDLGRLSDGRCFSITAGLGLDAAMIRGASSAAKRRYGVAAYVASAARALPSMRTFRVVATAGGQTFERRASLAMIANVGAVMGGRFGLGPGVRPDDGLLDLCLLSPSTPFEATEMAWRMFRRDFRPHPRMLFVRSDVVRIEALDAVAAQADGELLDASILEAKTLPAAARLLAPPAADG